MSRDLLVSAAVATLIGGIAALLIAPKAGEAIRKDLCDLYEGLSDKGEFIADRVSKKRKIIASLLNNKSEWSDKAKGIFNELSSMECQEDEFSLKEILVGTVIGGVLGAAAGLLLAPKSGLELRNDLAGTYEDLSDKAEEFQKKGKTFVKKARNRSNKWLEMASELADGVIDNAQEKGEEYLNGAQDKINDVIEWATLGYKVWQGIKKRR